MTNGSILLMLSCALLAQACGFVRSDCWTGDFGKYAGVDETYLETFELEWYSNAKVCKMGRYLLASPADSDSEQLFILDMQEKSMHIFVSSKNLTIFKSKHNILAQFGKSDDGRSYDSLNYEGFDATSNSTVSVFDFELDGIADMRITSSVDDTSRKTEQRIGSEWHEIVKRSDDYGIIVEGEFLPVKEAKELILNNQKRRKNRPDG